MVYFGDGGGATVTITGWTTFRATRIGGLREYHDIIDDTALGDDSEKRVKGKLNRSDPIEIDFIYDPDVDSPKSPSGGTSVIHDDDSAITITIKYAAIDVDGNSFGTPAQYSFSGFVSEQTTPELTHGGQMLGSLVVVPNGAITHADASI